MESENLVELESLGILRTNKLPQNLAWLSENQKHVLLYAHLCGENGLHKSQIKKIQKTDPNCILELEIRQYVKWLTDKFGKPIAVALTWQGDEVAKLLLVIAKNQTKQMYHPPKSDSSDAGTK